MERELEDLFERFARRGDVAALERVFDRAAPELLRIALHLAHDAAQAEDLVQATFVRAIENAARFEPGRPLLPWLIGILAHEAARARRDGRRVLDPERLAERTAADPAEESAGREVSSQLAAAVLALPSPYRDVLAPHLLEGARAVDIAKELGRAPGTVRMQIQRGLELLRKALPPSFATAAALATGTRGHAAMREVVRARAAELATALAGSSTPVPSPWIARLGETAMSMKLALALGIPALVLGLWLTGREGRAPRPLALEPSPVIEAMSATALVEPAGEAPRATATEQQRAPFRARHAAPAPLAKPEVAGRAEVKPTELAGRVLGPMGPAAGAHVSLLRGEARGFDLLDPTERRATELVAETIADGRGEFRFALERGMPVDVHAELGAGLVADTPDHHAGQFVELVLDAGHLVHGHVTRARDGGPVDGARVRVLGARTPALERETRTLADGSYAVRATFTQNAELAVSHPTDGFAEWIDVRFGSDGNAQEDVVLEPGITVEGGVTDAETGEPIAGATVGEHWTFERSVATDRHGIYRFVNCAPERPDLYARARAHGEAAPSGPPRMVDGRMRLDFQLRSARTAVGRIVDDSAEPVAGAYVAAVGQGGHTDWIAARTDADGRFTLEPLAPEIRHALFVSRRGFAVQVYEFPASELDQPTTDLGQLTLRVGQLVAGRALGDDGEPVAEALVTLQGWNTDRFVLSGGETGGRLPGNYFAQRRTLSDGQGRFWFGAVAPGNFLLSAVKSGRVQSGKISLMVQEGTDRDDLELVFATGLAIRGLVRDEAGNPLSDARVSAMIETEDGSFSGSLPVSRVDAGGAFEILGLADGTYELEAYRSLVRDENRDEPWISTYLEHVAPGGEPVTLVLERGLTIEGVLRDALGNPAAGVYVQPRIDGWIARVEGDTSDVEGRFRLVVPKNTRWTVDVYSDDEDEALLSEPGIAAGTRDLELRLPAE